MIPEEHLENDEISFQNVYGHNEPVKLRIQDMFITYSLHTVSVSFCFVGILA